MELTLICNFFISEGINLPVCEWGIYFQVFGINAENENQTIVF